MRIFLLSGVCLALMFSASGAEAKEKAVSLSLDQAILQAIQKAPEIAKTSALSKAADGARRQSTAWTNPQLSVESENIGGSGPYKGYDSAETTASVSQLVEIGGKRSARRAIAERDQSLAQLQQKAETINVVRQVKVAFARAAVSQERLKLAKQQSNLANDILGGVKRRVDAAADPLYQKNKARIALASSELELKKAQRENDASIKILGQLVGGEVSKVDANSLYDIVKPQEGVIVEPDVVISREDLEIERSKATLALEKANAVPDPTITAGVRNFKEEDSNAFVVGVSFPIPVLNLNRGNIQKAGYELAARDAERQQNIRNAKTEILDRQRMAADAYQEAETLKKTILPEAEAALKDARRGYDAGSFAYLDVLDAQRTLFESKTTYLNALLDYQINRAEVEYLTAPVSSPEKK